MYEGDLERPRPAHRTGVPGGVRDAWRTAGLGACAVLAVGLAPAAATAQQVQRETTQSTGERVRVYLDCQTRNCRSNEFRTEIGFVNWVREPTAADVHVIVTGQSTGAGRQYVFDMIGRGDLAELQDQLRYDALSTATQREVLDGLTALMKAGLVRYLAHRGGAATLAIGALEGSTGSEGTTGTVAPEDDAWDYWIFRIGLNGDAEGEEREEERNFRASLSANRTTPEWKIDIQLDGDIERREVELSDGTFTDDSDDWSFDVLLVRSLTPHLSTGMELGANSSTQRNQEVGGRTAAAFEWNYFPYEEANRRQFVVHYQLGYSRVRYEEMTIFEKLEETLPDQRLSVAYDTRQPWGNASAAAHYSTILDDFSKYSVSFDGRLSFRIFRGLELDLNGEYEVIRDQLYLPAEDLTDEEILVRRRNLATGYQYEVRIGISYRFGSIFNNVVNNRFPWSVRRRF